MSDCGVCLTYEGDYAEVFHSKDVRARKPYECCECNREIAVGALHQKCTMLGDGEWKTYRTCAPCAEIRKAFSCDGECVGGIFWEEMTEYAFAEMNVSCLDKLTTAAAKQYLMQRWQEWKGLND